MNSQNIKLFIISVILIICQGCASTKLSSTDDNKKVNTLSIHKLTPEKIERKIHKKMARSFIKDESSRRTALLLLDNKYWHLVLGNETDLKDIDRLKIYDSQGNLAQKVKISSLGEIRISLKIIQKLQNELSQLLHLDGD